MEAAPQTEHHQVKTSRNPLWSLVSFLPETSGILIPCPESLTLESLS